MALVLNGDGAIAGLTAGGLPDASVTQSELAAGVAGNGPAFWAYPTADTTVSSATDVVIANGNENYDTAGCFNNTGSTVGGIPAYAFMPNVAGFYLITSAIMTELSTNPSRFINVVRINGTGSQRLGDTSVAFGPSQFVGSMLIYFNGTTDYVQQVIYLAATTPRYSSNPAVARFSGFLARAT